MPKNGKNVLAIMLGKGKGPSGADAPEEGIGPEPEEDEVYGDAFAESASAAMAASQAGDEEGFASALKDAIVTCLEEQGI